MRRRLRPDEQKRDSMYTVALIGAGNIARAKHIPAWLKLSRDVTLMAVCDRDLAAAVAAADGTGAATYKSVERMLEEVGPDFVDICTPPESHANVAVAAMAAGARVLIEKPMAATEEDCAWIMDAESLYKGSVSVAHSELFYPNVAEALRKVEAGAIGELTGMRIFRSTPVGSMTSDPDHWANKLPGGAIGETGPHVVYMAQAFIGAIREVSARGRKLLSCYPWSPYEDYRLELVGDKATCSAVLTYTSEHSAAHVDLWGTAGMLRLELQSRSLAKYDRRGQSPVAIGASALNEASDIIRGVMTTAGRHLVGRQESPHDALIREFFECSVRGLPLPVNSEDGLMTVQVMGNISSQLQAQSIQMNP